MKAFIDYSIPNQNFWHAYTKLWNASLYKSVFQAPHFIKTLSEKCEQSLAIYKCLKGGKLYGAAFFKKENGTYTFLSDIKTDHNFFVIHNKCSEEEIKIFFQYFFKEAKKDKWGLTLNSQPSWASYMDTLIQAGKASKLFFQHINYTVCPVLETETPQELFRQLNKSRNTRYKMNRLKKEQEAVFEIFTGEEDLDKWVRQFCQSHIKRWDKTSTPSAYLDIKRKTLLKEYLSAWINDKVLARFSIKVGEDRIALCIGLVQENSLLHHSHTYDASYGKYSPGKVLLRFIGEWMESQQLNKLDFGTGNEPFKYNYANKELKLNRIFISTYQHIPFIMKARLIKSVKENQKIYDLYKEKVKPKVNQVFK